MKTPFLVPATVASLAILFGNFSAQATPPPAKTLENLRAAYRGEAEAHISYQADARKADAEGFANAARLFRAAAAAEAIHRGNHAVAIRALGGQVPTIKPKPASPQGTAQNLEESIKDETFEGNTMYPNDVANARAERAKAAIKTFEWAGAVERGHAELFKAALAELQSTTPVLYFVCGSCGNTTTAIPKPRCPVCAGSPRAYTRIP